MELLIAELMLCLPRQLQKLAFLTAGSAAREMATVGLSPDGLLHSVLCVALWWDIGPKALNTLKPCCLVLHIAAR